MTKRRIDGSPEAALLEIVDLLGWAAACRVAGRHERTLRTWSEPDQPAGVPYQVAIALDLAFIEAGGDGAPFERCYRAALEIARARGRACLASPIDCAADAARETGEAIAAHFQAIQPGAGAPARERAVQESREAIHAIARSIEQLERGDAA